MKGLPKSIRIKLLESDPTPDLNKMVSFVQRYRAIQEYAGDESGTHVAGVASEKNGENMASLVVSIVFRLCVLNLRCVLASQGQSRTVSGGSFNG